MVDFNQNFRNTYSAPSTKHNASMKVNIRDEWEGQSYSLRELEIPTEFLGSRPTRQNLAHEFYRLTNNLYDYISLLSIEKEPNKDILNYMMSLLGCRALIECENKIDYWYPYICDEDENCYPTTGFDVSLEIARGDVVRIARKFLYEDDVFEHRILKQNAETLKITIERLYHGLRLSDFAVGESVPENKPGSHILPEVQIPTLRTKSEADFQVPQIQASGINQVSLPKEKLYDAPEKQLLIIDRLKTTFIYREIEYKAKYSSYRYLIKIIEADGDCVSGELQRMDKALNSFLKQYPQIEEFFPVVSGKGRFFRNDCIKVQYLN